MTGGRRRSTAQASEDSFPVTTWPRSSPSKPKSKMCARRCYRQLAILWIILREWPLVMSMVECVIVIYYYHASSYILISCPTLSPFAFQVVPWKDQAYRCRESFTDVVSIMIIIIIMITIIIIVVIILWLT